LKLFGLQGQGKARARRSACKARQGKSMLEIVHTATARNCCKGKACMGKLRKAASSPPLKVKKASTIVTGMAVLAGTDDVEERVDDCQWHGSSCRYR